MFISHEIIQLNKSNNHKNHTIPYLKLKFLRTFQKFTCKFFCQKRGGNYKELFGIEVSKNLLILSLNLSGTSMVIPCPISSKISNCA
jgi:hypothetical protein